IRRKQRVCKRDRRIGKGVHPFRADVANAEVDAGGGERRVHKQRQPVYDTFAALAAGKVAQRRLEEWQFIAAWKTERPRVSTEVRLVGELEEIRHRIRLADAIESAQLRLQLVEPPDRRNRSKPSFGFRY